MTTTVEKITAEVVAWCAGCEWYVDANEIGTRCPGDECKRILRRRVGYICRACEDHPIYFDRERFRNHAGVHVGELPDEDNFDGPRAVSA